MSNSRLHFDLTQLVGNTLAKTCLQSVLQTGQMGHALLFTGPSGIGKSLFARGFASSILCMHDKPEQQRAKIEKGNHPDLHIYRPEGKMGIHPIASIQSLIHEMSFPPYEACRKVFIIEDAERLQQESANALLKTLEEPTRLTQIILVSSAPALIIPTIRSRCQVVHFRPIPKEEIAAFLAAKRSVAPEVAEQIAHIAQGSLTMALDLLEDEKREMRKNTLTLLSDLGEIGFFEIAQAIKGICEKQEELFADSFDLRSFDGIFDLIYSWHRDLELMQVNGDLNKLINIDYIPLLEKRKNRGKVPTLHDIEAKCRQAQKAITRNLTPTQVFENLFLQIS